MVDIVVVAVVDDVEGEEEGAGGNGSDEEDISWSNWRFEVVWFLFFLSWRRCFNR